MALPSQKYRSDADVLAIAAARRMLEWCARCLPVARKRHRPPPMDHVGEAEEYMTERVNDYLYRCMMLVKLEDGPEADAECEALDKAWLQMTQSERDWIYNKNQPKQAGEET